MKNIAVLVAGLLVLGLLGFGVTYLLTPKEGPKLDAEAKAYIDATLPAIISTWDETAYANALADMPVATKDQLIQRFMAYKALGAMTTYNGSHGNGAVSNGKVRAIFAAYATFANGEGNIAIAITRTSGSWKILNMNVTSPALTPATTPTPEPAPAPAPDAGTALSPSAR